MPALYVVVRVVLDLETQDVTMQPIGPGTLDEREAVERARVENEAVGHLPSEGEQVEFKVIPCQLPSATEPDWRGMVERSRDILWPGGNMDHEWEGDTLDLVAAELRPE